MRLIFKITFYNLTVLVGDDQAVKKRLHCWYKKEEWEIYRPLLYALFVRFYSCESVEMIWFLCSFSEFLFRNKNERTWVNQKGRK